MKRHSIPSLPRFFLLLAPPPPLGTLAPKKSCLLRKPPLAAEAFLSDPRREEGYKEPLPNQLAQPTTGKSGDSLEFSSFSFQSQSPTPTTEKCTWLWQNSKPPPPKKKNLWSANFKTFFWMCRFAVDKSFPLPKILGDLQKKERLLFEWVIFFFWQTVIFIYRRGCVFPNWVGTSSFCRPTRPAPCCPTRRSASTTLPWCSSSSSSSSSSATSLRSSSTS